MILHLVSASPFASKALQQCLAQCSREDGILLLADGVYAALDAKSPVAQYPHLFVLKDDLSARGLLDKPHCGDVIDYAQWVALTIKYDKTLSWR